MCSGWPVPENSIFQNAQTFTKKPCQVLLFFHRPTGHRKYELKDHLGNVRVVASDRKNTDATAEILSYSNNYPFGMNMPGLNWQSSSYRYGFNGKEQDKNFGLT